MYDDFDEMMTEASTEMGAVDATKLRHEAEAAAAAEKEKEAAAKKAAKEEALREKKREAALKSEQEKVAKALKAAALVQEKKKKELAAKKAAESAAANGGDAAPKSPAQKPAPINFAAMASKSPASPPEVKQQPPPPQPQQHHHHHHPSGGDSGISDGPGLPQPAPVTAPGGSWNEPLQLPPSSPGKQVGDVSQLNQQLPEPSMQVAGQVPAGLQVRSRFSDRAAFGALLRPCVTVTTLVSGLTRRSTSACMWAGCLSGLFVCPLAGNERGCNAELEPAAFVSIVDEPARAARAAHRL